jgi:hypothetical protein
MQRCEIDMLAARLGEDLGAQISEIRGGATGVWVCLQAAALLPEAVVERFDVAVVPRR